MPTSTPHTSTPPAAAPAPAIEPVAAGPHLRRRWLWPLGAAVAAVALGAAGAGLLLRGNDARASAPAAAPPAPAVSVATVEEVSFSPWEEFSGRIEPVERVELRSRVAGAVQALHFREGALVRKGDLLITIDPAPFAAEVDRADAQLAAARARLEHARAEQQRARRLLDEQAIAEREADERQNTLREAEANLRAAQAQAQSARLNLGYSQVRAPIAGRIGKSEITVGNLVSAGPGAPVLATLVSVDPIYAGFDADEEVLGRALKRIDRIGQGASGGAGKAGSLRDIDRVPVQIGTAADSGTPRQGRLQLIDNQVDAKSGTVRLRAVFDNADGALIPGQFARVRLGQPEPERAILVNERAVGTDQNRKFVLVVDAEGRTAYREVALGASHDGLRVVKSGLKPGERVVVNGLQHVRPGMVVTPQPVPMAPKAERRSDGRVVAEAAAR